MQPVKVPAKKTLSMESTSSPFGLNKVDRFMKLVICSNAVNRMAFFGMSPHPTGASPLYSAKSPVVRGQPFDVTFCLCLFPTFLFYNSDAAMDRSRIESSCSGSVALQLKSSLVCFIV